MRTTMVHGDEHCSSRRTHKAGGKGAKREKRIKRKASAPHTKLEDTTTELELIQTQMAQKPMLRAEVGMRVRCANKASAE